MFQVGDEEPGRGRDLPKATETTGAHGSQWWLSESSHLVNLISLPLPFFFPWKNDTQRGEKLDQPPSVDEYRAVYIPGLAENPQVS